VKAKFVYLDGREQTVDISHELWGQPCVKLPDYGRDIVVLTATRDLAQRAANSRLFERVDNGNGGFAYHEKVQWDGPKRRPKKPKEDEGL
jgi:hypothetical protein